MALKFDLLQVTLGATSSYMQTGTYRIPFNLVHQLETRYIYQVLLYHQALVVRIFMSTRGMSPSTSNALRRLTSSIGWRDFGVWTTVVQAAHSETTVSVENSLLLEVRWRRSP